MILVDSSVWVEFFNDFNSPEKKELEKYLEDGEIIYTTGIIAAEILAGVKKENTFLEVKEILSQLPHLSPTFEDYVKAAELYRHLRSKGFTIRNIIDCLIAEMVAENGLMLLQKDRDFKNIKRFYPSLQLVEIYTADTQIKEEDQSEES